MSTAPSPRDRKRKLDSESNDADYERVIDQLVRQVAQKDEKICQLKTAIDFVLQHLWEVVESPQRTLPSPSTVLGKPSGKKERLADGSPKISTPDTNSEAAPTNIPGGRGKNLFPNESSDSEKSKNKRPLENESKDRSGNKRRRRGGASLTIENLGDK